MIANIRSGSSPGGALYYNKEKVDRDEAEILYWQKILEPFDKHGRMDVDACMESFWPYLEAGRRTNNTVYPEFRFPGRRDCYHRENRQSFPRHEGGEQKTEVLFHIQ